MNKPTIFGMAVIISIVILLTVAMASYDSKVVKEEQLPSGGELELVGEPYFVGDMIQMVGKINDPSIDFITIEILDEKNNVMEIERYGVYGTDGHFQKTIEAKKYMTLAEYWNAGTYTVRVAGDGVELTKSFEINVPPNKPEISVLDSTQ